MTGFNRTRRTLLKLAGAAPALGLGLDAQAQGPLSVALLTPPGDAVAMSVPAQWAAGELEKALVAKGAKVSRAAAPGALAVALKTDPALPAEGFRLAPDGGAVTVSAADPRGMVYGLLELAERVKFGANPRAALTVTVLENAVPATRVRSIARIFADAPHDLPWFHDRDFWRNYLDLMAACRFNRFNLTLGIAYDFPRGVTGDYLHFVYPYLLSVPGYDQVRVEPLPSGEREKNWDSFRFIAQETAKRGLEFQVGIWTHAYAWTDSPNSDHHIVGLNAQNHAPYCRDALALLLKSCPQITGVTLRIHGESGIPEGSYDFWQTVFNAFPTIGRTIEIEMHAKGLNQTMIDMAHKTGMRVKAGPKYSAEHQSLGYHQADIRAFEIPRADAASTGGVFAVSNGDRRFTRYGYADMYQDGSNLGLIYRLWPGTQRHLLKGDAALAAAMARSASFCDADGLEIMEPLTFKGREGSSQPGGRNAYLDESLNPPDGDFAKFEISYRQWGRTLYDPAAKPDAWRRAMRVKLGAGADAAQDALAYATRILALLTSAHLPSASNHEFWYEIYVNMGITPQPTQNADTFDPKVFGNCSPLDPQTFSSVFSHVDDLLANKPNCKYSPVEVASWVEQLTASARASLAVAVQRTPKPGADFRRLEEDVRIQIGLGEFFAAKFRAALLYRVFEQTHDAKAGEAAVARYEAARAAWAAMADRAAIVYRADIAYGRTPFRRGHWSDRLPAIDTDIAAMKVAVGKTNTAPGRDAALLIAAVTGRPARPQIAVVHSVPVRFHPGSDLTLSCKAAADVTATLHYRHVDQAERWTSVPMTGKGGSFEAAIPASYTASPYPLQYYFEFQRGGKAWSHPAFNASLSNTPYFAVFRRD
jgi:hypothetical protein